MQKIKQSLYNNRKGILLMLISSICVCIGQLLWKLSTDGNFMFLCIGFLFYGIGALVMLVAYKFGSLSVLQPMLSLNYVITIVLSVFVLKEDMSILRVIGVLVIMVGVVLIGGGDE